MEITDTRQLAYDFVQSIIMAALDEKGNYQYVSPVWEATRRVKAADVIGHNVLEFVPDSKVMDCLRTGQIIRGEMVQYEGYPVLTTYLPRYDSAGKVCGVFLYSIFEGRQEAENLIRKLSTLTSEVDFYKEELSKERGARYDLDHIVGASPQIQRLKERVLQAARSNSTVLIEGETGPGKELIAHAIHAMGARRSENFVRVNCAAIPAETMDVEFFGTAQGSHGTEGPGRVGRFELADRGTLFLDEVNLLTPVIQPRFLHVMQDMEIDAVAGSTRHIDVRIIGATNVSLEEEVRLGKFRSDLYYLFNVIRIQAPPLRDHREDIPLITQDFIRRMNRQLGMHVEGVREDVFELFAEYDWPGNVRELQNVLEAAMNLTTGPELEVQDFPLLLQRIRTRRLTAPSTYEDFDLRRARKTFEATFLRDALIFARGNKARCAELLGISRTELYKKIEDYGL